MRKKYAPTEVLSSSKKNLFTKKSVEQSQNERA